MFEIYEETPSVFVDRGGIQKPYGYTKRTFRIKLQFEGDMLRWDKEIIESNREYQIGEKTHGIINNGVAIYFLEGPGNAAWVQKRLVDPARRTTSFTGRYHPDNYYLYLNRPLPYIMKRMQQFSTITVKSDGKGIFVIKVKAKSHPKSQSRIKIDSKRGCLPLSWHDEDSSVFWGEKRFSKTTNVWKEYAPSVWFLQSRVRREERKGKAHRSELKVIEFEANVDIDDSVFTIESLNIPEGTKVSDEITGTEYKYGETIPANEQIQEEGTR